MFENPANHCGIDHHRIKMMKAIAEKFADQIRNYGEEINPEAFDAMELANLFKLDELALIGVEVTKAIQYKLTKNNYGNYSTTGDRYPTRNFLRDRLHNYPSA